MRRVVAALVLLSGVGVAGCSMFSYGHFDPLATGQAFDDSQKRFNRLVRWGQWEKAAEMVATDDREAFLAVGRTLTDVRFTDWDVTALEMGEKFETAQVEVRIEGYRQSDMTQHEVRMLQEWSHADGVSSPWVVRPHLDEIAGAFAAR